MYKSEQLSPQCSDMLKELHARLGSPKFKAYETFFFFGSFSCLVFKTYEKNFQDNWFRICRAVKLQKLQLQLWVEVVSSNKAFHVACY